MSNPPEIAETLGEYQTPNTIKEDMRKHRAVKQCSVQAARVMAKEEHKIKVKENLRMAISEYHFGGKGEEFLAAIVSEMLEIM
jgi:hypothetical protein